MITMMIFTIIIIITIIILSIIIIIIISRNFCYLQTSLFSTNAILNQSTSEVQQPTPVVTTPSKETAISHFGKNGSTTGDEAYRMPHPVWYEPLDNVISRYYLLHLLIYHSEFIKLREKLKTSLTNSSFLN